MGRRLGGGGGRPGGRNQSPADRQRAINTEQNRELRARVERFNSAQPAYLRLSRQEVDTMISNMDETIKRNRISLEDTSTITFTEEGYRSGRERYINRLINGRNRAVRAMNAPNFKQSLRGPIQEFTTSDQSSTQKRSAASRKVRRLPGLTSAEKRRVIALGEALRPFNASAKGNIDGGPASVPVTPTRF